MGSTRRNPFRGLVDTIGEMNRTRERWMTAQETEEDRQRTHMSAWVPTTDIFARGEDLVIRVELAGVMPGDVDVALSNGVLTICGERVSELDDEEVSYYVRERFYGIFRRTITLPEGIDESKISAAFKNGMLQIAVQGGAAEAELKRIQVRDESD
ncbi:MAG TPA: Hsp20/alpha crystallin family protein [Rubrobacter sp.]|nr:Hsp20/alpha crystallin family protein [Rubrobacter sp.]